VTFRHEAVITVEVTGPTGKVGRESQACSILLEVLRAAATAVSRRRFDPTLRRWDELTLFALGSLCWTRIGDHSPAAHRRSNDYGCTDEHHVLDDVLPF